MNSKLSKTIQRLKKEKNALILAHNYQIPEVQDIADYVGDSLELSRKAAECTADIIVFCGVYFMAETAAILAPGKTVLIPDRDAGCPMVDMAPLRRVKKFLENYPGATVVSYVNSSAEVKALSDYCCTSANGIGIIESIDKTADIVFIPDKHLGGYIAEQTGRNMVLYDGACTTHAIVEPEDVIRTMKRHPEAEILVHPECTFRVRALAHYVLSTGGMCRHIQNSPADSFIIGTESGIIHRFKRENPEKRFYPVSPEIVCPNMKRITLEKVHRALDTMTYHVTVPEPIREKAFQAVSRMTACTAAGTVP